MILRRWFKPGEFSHPRWLLPPISNNTPDRPNFDHGSSLTSWIGPFGDEHVVGIDVNGALHEYFWIPGGAWLHRGISTNTPDLPNLVPASSRLTSWKVLNDDGTVQSYHVVGLGGDGTIHAFYFIPSGGDISQGNWSHNNISQRTGTTFS